MTPSIYTIQIVGESDKLDGFLQALGGATCLKVVHRVSGIARGEKTTVFVIVCYFCSGLVDRLKKPRLPAAFLCVNDGC